MESLHSPHSQVRTFMSLLCHSYVHTFVTLSSPPPPPPPPAWCRQEDSLDFCGVLCLYLLRSALPFIKPARSTKDKKLTPSPSSSSSSDPLAVPSAILAHLSGLLDSSDEGAEASAAPLVQRLAQDIVVGGVVVFFPDASARKDYLLNMIGSISVGVA